MSSSSSSDDAKGGEVVFAGYASWSMVGKSKRTLDFDGVENQILWGFHRLRPLVGIKITKVISGPVSCTCMAIDDTGSCYTWGRNIHGQLGLNSTVNVYNPTKVELSGTIVDGACGPNHSLLVTASGELLAAGAGKCGQLGIGKKPELVKKFVTVDLAGRAKKVACGKDFSMVVDTNGVIYSFGHPEYGCLGNGTDGKILEKANKFSFEYVLTPTPIVALQQNYGDVTVAEVACGANHTCCMDDTGRVYTWGFGAYGRLGHKDNKDQHEPVAVELFSFEPPPLKKDVPKFLQHHQPRIRADKVTCGGTATFVNARDPMNCLYMFGITKRTGEAKMYPTVVANVQGWQVRSVSCGATSVAVASERSLITWGNSPTFGELGYGEGGAKSSTVSADVLDLKGALTLQCVSGLAHTLAIVDSSDEVSNERIEKLPIFDPPEVDPKITTARNAKAKADKRAMLDKKKAKRKKKTAVVEESEEEEEESEGQDDDGDSDAVVGSDDGEDDGESDYDEGPKAKKRKTKKK